MEACDRLSLTSIEPRDVLASASEEDGLLDILQRHLLLEPLYGQLAIRGRVPTTDTGPGSAASARGPQRTVFEPIDSNPERPSRKTAHKASSRLGSEGSQWHAGWSSERSGRAVFLRVLSDTCRSSDGTCSELRQLALTKDEASRAPFGSQRDVNEELEGSIGEFVRGGCQLLSAANQPSPLLIFSSVLGSSSGALLGLRGFARTLAPAIGFPLPTRVDGHCGRAGPATSWPEWDRETGPSIPGRCDCWSASATPFDSVRRQCHTDHRPADRSGALSPKSSMIKKIGAAVVFHQPIAGQIGVSGLKRPGTNGAPGYNGPQSRGGPPRVPRPGRCGTCRRPPARTDRCCLCFRESDRSPDHRCGGDQWPG